MKELQHEEVGLLLERIISDLLNKKDKIGASKVNSGIPSGLIQDLFGSGLLGGSLFGEGLFGMSSKPHYNFGSGEFDYDIREEMPPSENKNIRRLIENINRKGVDSVSLTPYESTIARMLKNETSIDVDSKAIIVIPESARHSVDMVLTKLTTNKGRVGMPVPNWHFWECMGGAKKGLYKFDFFDALNPDQLIEGFKRIAGQVDTLLLVNPANPIGYHITSDVAKEIGSLAERYGVKVVFDELLRGNQPIGKRETPAAFIPESYIVEGMSHRFGENPLGRISYILVPEGGVNMTSCDVPVPLGGEILKVAYNHCSAGAVNTLATRNAAFDEGLASKTDRVSVVRPSISSITGIVNFPDDFPLNGKEFFMNGRANGLSVVPVEGYFPDGHKVPDECKSMVRVATGSSTIMDCYKGGARFGEIMNAAYEQLGPKG